MEFQGVQRVKWLSGKRQRLMGNTGRHLMGKPANPMGTFPTSIDDQSHDRKEFAREVKWMTCRVEAR